MSLKAPTSGFKEFLLYRESYSDSFEIILLSVPFAELEKTRDPQVFETIKNNSRTFVFEHIDLVKKWLFQVGVPRLFVDKVVDWSLNFRIVRYDLTQHRIFFPACQDHPFEPKAQGKVFRAPRPSDKIDPFDPLQEIAARMSGGR